MDYNAKRARLSGVIYIILALMLATIMCVTLFTAIASKKEQNPPSETVPVTDKTNSENDPSASVIPPETNPSAAVDAGPSAIVTAPDTETSAPETEKPASAEPTYFIMPVNGIVTVEYSGDLPVYSITMNDYRVHTGIDIEAPVGNDVKCCASGIISNIYNDDMKGKCISVDHGDGIVSVYRGTSDELPEGIAEGASVIGGAVLGTIGETALFENAQPAHLHFEMIVNNKNVNPLDYLSYNADAATSYYYTD